MKRKVLCVALVAVAVRAMAEGMGASASMAGGVAGGTGALGFNVADTSRVVDLDEVVVVAQPKESLRLRRQPLASTVFTDAEMQRLGVQALSSLSKYVPSFVVPDYGARYTSSIYVRGLGSRSGDPAMGVYFDNIPLVNKSTYNRHIYMLDRIDVLRGPQGTLYGMNTEGGIVRMYSKNPMNYQGTDVAASMASGLGVTTEVAHYHRPSDEFAFSATAFYSGQRGFFDNANLGEDADLSNEAGGRMRFVFMPDSRLTFDLTSDYQYVNQNAFAYGMYDEETGGWAEPSTTFMNGYRRQMLNMGLNVSYRHDGFLLSLATGYQFLDDLMQMDQDYLPDDYMRLEQAQKLNVITQEATLRSLRRGRWQHASGVFFSYQWLHTDAPVSFGDAMNSMILSSMGMPPSVASAMSISDNYVPGTFKTPQLNIGIYHESNFTLSERLMLTLGLRYDHQQVEIEYDSYSHFVLGLNMPPRPAVSSRFMSVLRGGASERYDQLLPKFALTYRLDGRGSNVYATVSKGFRAGGYNLQMFSDIFRSEQSALGMELMQLMQGDMTVEHDAGDYENINRTISYKPEVSWNYEVGAHLNLFGGSLHLDAAAYYMHISNQQLSVMASDYGYGRMMVNAGKSSSWGVELSMRGKAVDDCLSWSATYGFTRSTFRQYADSVMSEDGAGYVLHDYKGKDVPFVPRHTFSGVVDYRFDLSVGGFVKSVTVGADVAGNGKVFWDAGNESSQRLYALLGAHVMLDFGKVQLNVWGKNLTDTRYNTFLVESSADSVRRSFAQRGNPLQVGLDVSLHL